MNHQLNRVPCSSQCSETVPQDRVAHILALSKRYGVDGVIFCTYQWCDIHQADLPTMVRLLEDSGMPVLCLEVERRLGGAQIETRLEAFREILAARDRS